MLRITYGVTLNKVILFRMSRYNYSVVIPILFYGGSHGRPNGSRDDKYSEIFSF